MGKSQLYSVDAVGDGIFDEVRRVSFLTRKDPLPGVIDDNFLLMYRQKLVLITAMTETEEDCGDWALSR